MRKIFLVGLAFLAILSVASCGIDDNYASSTSDQHVCVFDGSERGGQRLKFQIPPGAESREIDENDQEVSIPASNRFWMVAGSQDPADRALADPGTPNAYQGNDRNGVPIYIEGQIRFRFNLERACEWYSLHGRRNEPLGFNVRGDANQGWFRWGNENFVVTMQEVISELGSRFDAEALHYNTVSENGTPARQELAQALGDAYTERLEQNIGGNFFCGTAESTADDPCPGITFQVRYAGPGVDSPLVRARDAVENTRRDQEREAAEAQLRAEQLANQLASEEAQQQLLVEELESADLQAQIDFAPCAPYAAAGLDCEGHHPQNVFPGG